MRPLPVITVLVIAFWESWRWLIKRTWVTPEEAATLIVTIAVVAGMVVIRVRRGHALAALPPLPFAAALLAYAAALALAPPILCAAIALTTTLAALYVAGHGRGPPVAFWGLCCLVLPIVPTLQFYLGYPMRIVSAVLTVPLLRLNGLDVAREGTALLWNGVRIQFDAPCSGVTMAWAGMLLVFAAATIGRYDLGRLARTAASGLRLLLAANLLRAASLFYVETGALPWSGEALHQGIGLAAFALALAVIMLEIGRWHRCAA
jgi:exosortase/archaeosortase family protein